MRKHSRGAAKPDERFDMFNATPMPERFWQKVDRSGECWMWTASVRTTGYGQFMLNNKPSQAHRVAYELEVGPIPEGLQLDHLCRVRLCVNPAHLEPVTNQENARRSPIMGLGQTKKTHCPQGHPYDEANTYVPPPPNKYCRICRACRSRRDVEHRERKKVTRANSQAL